MEKVLGQCPSEVLLHHQTGHQTGATPEVGIPDHCSLLSSDSGLPTHQLVSQAADELFAASVSLMIMNADSAVSKQPQKS